jgi:hypothetical protein
MGTYVFTQQVPTLVARDLYVLHQKDWPPSADHYDSY